MQSPSVCVALFALPATGAGTGFDESLFMERAGPRAARVACMRTGESSRVLKKYGPVLFTRAVPGARPSDQLRCSRPLLRAQSTRLVLHGPRRSGSAWPTAAVSAH